MSRLGHKERSGSNVLLSIVKNLAKDHILSCGFGVLISFLGMVICVKFTIW